MGQSAGLIMGAAGAVVGGFFGGPMGAEIGFMAGSMLGAILFPPKPPTPANVRVQDSAYGKFIPRVYGLYRLAGNVIWMGQPHNHDPSGKGMGGKSQQPYTTVSFAVGLCDGPITGVRRIWANGQLIYDVSSPSDFQALSGSATMVTNFTVYPGDEIQLPDPTMQSQLGAANVLAYRGLAYVVFNELNLQQWGNYMPSLTFEVATNIPPAYQSFTATTLTGSGIFIGTAPYLTANGGQVVGASNGNAIVGNLTPYGSSVTSQFSLAGVNMSGLGYTPAGYADTAGLWAGTAWVHPNGVVDDFSLANGVPGVNLNIGNGTNYWRNGNDLYVSTSRAGSPISRLQIVGPAPAGSGVVNKGGTVLAQSVNGAWFILGGSSSYVYAYEAGSGNIYRLDRNTLATVAVFTGSPVCSLGYVWDDDHIYTYYNSGSVSLYRPSLGSYTTLGQAPFNTGSNGAYTMTVINSDLIMFAGGGLANTQLGYMTRNMGGNPSPVTTGAIVADVCSRAGLQSSQYDVSQLTDVVTGYAITDHSSSRQDLAPLQAAYFFDVSDCDGLLRFVKRGGAPVVSIPWDDLGASTGAAKDSASTNPIVETLLQEFELPRSETITYVSQTLDYQSNTQREQRMVTSSNLDEAVNVPIVMSDAEAKTRVQAMLWERWTKRQQFTWSTDYKYLALEPGDVVTLNNPNGATYQVRVTKVALDGKGTLGFTGDLSVSAIYPNVKAQVSQGGVAAGFTKQSVPYSGPTALAVLDVPPLRSQDTSQGLYIAACGYTSSWPGALIDISRDDVNFSQLTSLQNPTPIGTATTALGNWLGGNLPDESSTVQVSLVNPSMTLSSTSYSSFLNGANAALIGKEIVFFRNAVQTAAGQYTLSGLLRGRLGTGFAMGTHQANETFVLLQSTIVPVSINLTDIGSAMYFDAYLQNIMGTTPSGAVTVTPSVARVKPLSPHLLKASHGSSFSTSDIVLRWFRQARVNTTWLDGTDVALDESAEVYTVSVYNGTTLARQYVLSNAPTAATWAGGGPSGIQAYPPFVAPSQPTFVYTAAMASNDGFSAGNTITFQVQQNSDQGVLGYAATATITR